MYEINKDFINLEEVTFKYRDRNIFQNLNLKINSSEMTTIVGSNGSGKTTLGKLIMGILKPNSGRILVDGRDIAGLTLGEIGQIIGYLFQNPTRQIFATTVMEELTFAMKFNKVSKEIIDAKVENVIDLFNLEKIIDANTYSLSQGEKQRLALATMLLNEPKYIILDEPTTGLDQKRKDDLKQIIINNLTNGIGILMISHDNEFIESISDRIIKIENGRVIDDWCR